MSYYVILDKPGYVHQSCPACMGTGKTDYYDANDRLRVGTCGYCAGAGYVVTKAKPDAVDPAR